MQSFDADVDVVRHLPSTGDRFRNQSQILEDENAQRSESLDMEVASDDDLLNDDGSMMLPISSSAMYLYVSH